MWRRWKAGQGKLCFVSCSHQRASAGKYLFPQTQQGLQFVQLSARTQNDGPRLLAQKLPERDNQPRIIDGPERVRNITSLFRCFTVMSDRSDHPSVPTYLRRPSCFSVRLERRFSVPACNLTERWSQRRSREARSRAEPRAAASLRRAWRARRALDLDGPLRPAQRLIRLGASELPLPLPTIPTARREAEAGSPSKSVTTTPSIAVILLTMAATNAALASGGMTNCCLRCGLRRFFLASARSCCHWPWRQCSAQRPCLPAGSTSIARGLLAAPNKPGRSIWLPRRHRRCAFWPRPASACGLAPPRARPPQAAGGFALLSRGWCSRPRRSGCRSRRRRLPRRRPSTGCGPSSTFGQGVCRYGSGYPAALALPR